MPKPHDCEIRIVIWALIMYIFGVASGAELREGSIFKECEKIGRVTLQSKIHTCEKVKE